MELLIVEILYAGFIILITTLSKEPLAVFIGVAVGKMAHHIIKNKKYLH